MSDERYCPNCEEPLTKPPDERSKLYALYNLLTDGTDPAGLVEDAVAYLREPVAETDELVEAVRRYLQVDGSHGAFDAIELGIARRRLIEQIGPVKPLTLADLVAERRAT